MKKEVYINAHSFDEALDFARDDYFWDIIEVGGTTPYIEAILITLPYPCFSK